MKKILLLFTALVLLSAGCAKKTSHPLLPYITPLQISEKKIFIEIVHTSEKMAQGLSGREKLTDQQGMLFDFRSQTGKKPAFWMKGMKFDLDIIWIKNKKIIGITQNVPAPQLSDEKLELYSPPSEVDMVLEVNAGWTNKNNIVIGDNIILMQK